MLRALALLALAALCCACSSTLEQHLDALSAHVDALSVRLDRIAPAPASPPAQGAQQQPQHVACRKGEVVALAEGEKLQEHDVDLGRVEQCADPADGACVKGKPASVVIARCKAGKL